MTNITPEMIEKAKAAKTAEELLSLAKKNNVEMTEEEAKAYFEQFNPKSGELSDDELDNVAGGGCGSSEETPAYDSPKGFFTEGCTVENYNCLCCVFPNSGCASGKRYSDKISFRGIIHFTSRTEWYVTCCCCGKDVVQGNQHPMYSYSFVKKE